MTGFDVIYITKCGRAARLQNCDSLYTTESLVTIKTPYGAEHHALADMESIIIRPKEPPKEPGDTDGNICKRCGSKDTTVMDIRWQHEERVRKRRCLKCGALWTTVERYYWDTERSRKNEE